jgi:hypothetical protein
MSDDMDAVSRCAVTAVGPSRVCLELDFQIDNSLRLE